MWTETTSSRRLLAIVAVVSVALASCQHRIAQEGNSLTDDRSSANELQEKENRIVEEQKRLARELGALEKKHAMLALQLEERKASVAQAERRIHDLERDLKQSKADTDAYIRQHELHIACAYADEAARGEGEYSEQTRECARVAAVYCALAMISPRFREKVAAARRRVEQAEDDSQAMKKQIAAEESQLHESEAELRKAEDAVDRVASDIAMRRQQLLGVTESTELDRPAVEF